MNSMPTYITSITSKGQATIPMPIRKLLKLTTNGKVLFSMSNGKVELSSPPKSLQETFGSIKPLTSKMSFQKQRVIAFDEKTLKKKIEGSVNYVLC